MATLLLADDSVTIQRVIELTFANESIRVVTAPDGHAATAMLESERPDIMLADVGLPAVDGYTLAERIKRNPATAAIPVVLLTGAFEPIDEARARRTGCNGVLVKPFEPQRVVGLVKSLLAGQTPDNLWPTDMPRIDTTVQAHEAARPPAARRDSVAEPGTMPPPSAIEEVFEIGLDDLDMAFSRLDPVAPPSRIDADSVSDFQRDIEQLRSVAAEPAWTPAPSRPLARDVVSHLPVEDATPVDAGDLDWDLPAAPSAMVESVPVSPSFPVAASPAPPAPPPAFAPPTPPAPPTPSVSSPVVLSTPWTPPAPTTPSAPSAPAPLEALQTSPTPLAPLAPPAPPAPPTPPAPPAPPTPVFAPWVPPQVVAAAPVEMPAPSVFTPAEPLPISPAPPTPPTPPTAATPPAAPPTPPTPPTPEPAPQYTAPTLAAAFSALLAAEQSQPASGKPAPTELSSSDAMVEAVVRRVAARLTAEVDRLVREELERLKR